MVVVTSVVPGMTAELYNGMSVQMLPVIKTMPGFIAHAGMAIAGGFQVIEFWESQEHFDAWYNGTVKPAAAAAGLAPLMTYVPAENIITK